MSSIRWINCKIVRHPPVEWTLEPVGGLNGGRPEPRTTGGHVTVIVQDDRPHQPGGTGTNGLALSIRPVDDTVLGDTVARFSRCGTQLYVNTSCPPEDQLWAMGEALDHLRGIPALGAQPVRPLRWSRSAPILPCSR